MTAGDLPAVNAGLNTVATGLLALGFLQMKRGRIPAHRACMVAAFGVSVIFLITYVLHKILVRGVHTPFGGEGPIRVLYYAMLVSHILLAIVIVPLVLVTLRHALAGRIERHRAWARWTFPIWFYVSLTGVLVFFFLYRWFPHA